MGLLASPLCDLEPDETLLWAPKLLAVQSEDLIHTARSWEHKGNSPEGNVRLLACARPAFQRSHKPDVPMHSPSNRVAQNKWLDCVAEIGGAHGSARGHGFARGCWCSWVNKPSMVIMPEVTYVSFITVQALLKAVSHLQVGTEENG